MTSSLVRRALLAAFIAAVSISGCKCGSKVTGAGCQSDEECRAEFNNSDRAFCDGSKSPPVCALHPKACDTAADCCPAQVCNAQGHYCFDKYTPCTQDGSCPAQGEVCKEIGVFAVSTTVRSNSGASIVSWSVSEIRLFSPSVFSI